MLGKRNESETLRGEGRTERPSEGRTEPRGPVPGTTRSYGRPDVSTPGGPAPSAPAPVMRETGRLPSAFAQFRTPRAEAETAPIPAAEIEGKRLLVGRHIVLSGEIRTCDRLVVEGCVEASLFDTRAVEIAPGGVFRGSASIESAEIGGLFEGDLVVRERLLLKGTGRIVGNVQYGELEIERGGVVSGRLDTLASDADRAHPAAAQIVPPAEETGRQGERGNGVAKKHAAAEAG